VKVRTPLDRGRSGQPKGKRESYRRRLKRIARNRARRRKIRYALRKEEE
jgi:hypothetical protein